MHAFQFINSPYSGAGLFGSIILLAILWTIVLKGFALWYAARGGQKIWFVVLLVINTLGILEIIYLIWFRPKSAELATEKETAPMHTSSSEPEA